MKIAVLHWATSSVGGINTTLQILRDEAISRGYTFDILASNPQKSKRPKLFPKRKRVRGGDTFITIDGEAPHHPMNVKGSIDFIKSRYDLVITSFLCPHPTKAYGDEPLFLPLLQGIKDAGIGLVGYIHDGYWDSYAEFGVLTLPLCDRTMVCQAGYAQPVLDAGFDVTPAFVPFRPWDEKEKYERPSREARLVSWLPQWKNIKGIAHFFEGILPAYARGYSVELYGNGIVYYQMRKERETWTPVVGKDHFQPRASGNGPAEFFGCVHEHKVPGILFRSGYMADFQGHGKPKYEAYRKGSYNHTIIEAMYHGAVPIVHESILNTPIPKNLVLTLSSAEMKDWSAHLDRLPPGEYNRKLAREYVMENHSAAVLLDRILGKVK